MSAWGQGGSLKSCDSLLKRVEENNDKLVELVILPMKTFGSAELNRLSNAIANGSNTNLRSISASGHSVSAESLKHFGSALSSQSKKLQESSCDNKIGITNIAIGSKDMGDHGVIGLCEGLEETHGALVESLDLGWKNLGKDGIQKVGSTFAQSKHLLHLELSRNDKIGCKGISAFCNAASEESGNPFCNLECLNLSECNIGATGAKCIAECLGGRLVDDASYKRIRLNLNSNAIGANGCDALKLMLARPSLGSVLSKLQISQCSISDKGITKLVLASKSSPCTGLTALDLSNNSITHAGAAALANSLVESWPDLVELNLAKNNLGSAGVVMVLRSLVQRNDITCNHPVITNETVMIMKSLLQDNNVASHEINSTLKELDLTETNCGIEGASAALMSGGLKSLRLFNNKLGSDGFYSISQLLQGGHPSIEHLDLGGNSADEDSVVALLDAIGNVQENKDRNNKLSVLEIGGNSFGEKADAALKRLKAVWPLLDVAHDKPIQRGVVEE